MVTRFDTASESVEVIDFMPLRSVTSHVIRIVKGISGRVTMSSEMALRFEYGSAKPWVEATDDRTIRANLRSRDGIAAIPCPASW